VSVSILRDRPRILIDLKEIDKQSNVVREFHQAQRHGRHPVIAQTEPWEKMVGMTASVIYDHQENRFKAWYMAGFYAPSSEQIQCLAHSADGISWTKPNVGLHEVLGSRDNNIVIPADYHDGKDHFETMLKDPLDSDPQRRYKAIGWSSYDWDGPLAGIYTATSADGMTWLHTPEPVFHYHPRPGAKDLGPVGDAQAMMVDTLAKRYVAYLRGHGGPRLHSFSDDFRTWTSPEPFLWPAHEEEALYNNTGFPYGEQYLGILTHFDKHPRANTQSLQLLTSRDAAHWDRVPAAESVVALGGVGRLGHGSDHADRRAAYSGGRPALYLLPRHVAASQQGSA